MTWLSLADRPSTAILLRWALRWAEQLGIPQVSYAEQVEIQGDHVIVKRQFEDQYHVLKVKLPCLITA